MKNTIIAVIAVAIIALGGFYFLNTKEEPAQEAQAPTIANEETKETMEAHDADLAAQDDKAEPVKAGTFAVDTAISEIHWTGRKTLLDGYEDTGTIQVKEGNVTVSEDGKLGGTIVIDMTTIKTERTGREGGESRMEQHVKSADFFDVETHPTATFEITESTPLEEELMYMVKGNLTIKGVTNEIEFPARVYKKDGALHARATTEIDRTRWDIRYGSDKFFDNLANNVIDDNFTVEFHLETEVDPAA